MGVFEMVVIVVALGVIAGVVNNYLRVRAKQGGLGAEQEARIGRIEERVKALEAVVTDHGYDLKRQFRDLERS